MILFSIFCYSGFYINKYMICFKGYLGGLELEIILGDIISLQGIVDCIVNPANERLDNAGGLAATIDSLAGSSYRAECQRLSTYFKSRQKGFVMETIAGNLRFKKILHVVGPIVDRKSGLSDTHKRDLKAAVMNTMVKTNELGYCSIAIPAVSCGIFGFPIESGAVCHIQAFKEYALNCQHPLLKKVVFILYEEADADYFLDEAIKNADDFNYAQIIELLPRQISQTH